MSAIYWQRTKRRRMFGTLGRELGKAMLWFIGITIVVLIVGVIAG